MSLPGGNSCGRSGAGDDGEGKECTSDEYEGGDEERDEEEGGGGGVEGGGGDEGGGDEGGGGGEGGGDEGAGDTGPFLPLACRDTTLCSIPLCIMHYALYTHSTCQSTYTQLHSSA